MFEINNNAFYEIKDLAEIAERTTLLKWIKIGKLKANKIGRKYLISGEILKDFLNNVTVNAQKKKQLDK